VFGTARVYAPNSVLVNEAMPVSVATLTEARWVELYNPGAATIDLSDLEVFSSTAMTAFTIPAGTSIDAGAYLVVGDSSDSAANGGAPVSLAWGSSLPLGVADQVALRVGGSTPFNLSSLSWVAGPADAGITASTPGFSVQSPEPAITTTGAPLTCTHAVTYGSAAQVGTPGAANETCFEYSLTRIPVAFEDVSSGTAVFPPGFNDQIFATITLPTPFKYFGADKTSAAVSSNGWVSFSPQTSNYSSNRTAPSTTSQPVGALAVFWDDLASSNTTFPNANVYWARVGDHVTIMWLHSTFWLPASDDMNFEVKLFDSGVIEYHYGTMTNNPGSTTARYAEGASATVWIERPTGTAALAIIRNTSATTAAGFIAPNTAYRFTPKN
jgi:hypothetical protein